MIAPAFANGSTKEPHPEIVGRSTVAQASAQAAWEAGAQGQPTRDRLEEQKLGRGAQAAGACRVLTAKY
jgi:hypothetical protein